MKFPSSVPIMSVQTRDGRADMTNFEMDLFDPRFHTNAAEKDEAEECCKHSIIKPACLPVTILALLLLMVRMDSFEYFELVATGPS